MNEVESTTPTLSDMCDEDARAVIYWREAMDPERQRLNREQFRRMADKVFFDDHE